MSIPQVAATPRQENSQPVARTQATLPAAPIRDSLSSAPASRDCVEIYCDVIKTILAFIKEKICFFLFSSPQQRASTPPPANSSSPTPEESPVIEMVWIPREIHDETLRRYEEEERRVAAFQNFVPEFPEDLDPNAIRNTHTRGLAHYNRTNRQAFDDMQAQYLHIIALMYPVLVAQLEAQRDSQFRLEESHLREIALRHPNYREIRNFGHERGDADDIQFGPVFDNFVGIYLGIIGLIQW